MAALSELVNGSVQTIEERPSTSLVFNIIGGLADVFPVWGSAVVSRDRLLRAFYKSESVCLSTVGIVSERDAGFEWKLEGPDRMVKIAHEMLNKVNFGKGMRNFIIQWDIDRLTQDKGAFTEIVKADPENPASPTISMNNLDPSKCMLTGNPLFPVIYTDAQGKHHRFPYYRVWHSTDLPTSEEERNGIQICAVSRLLLQAQLRRDINQVDREKASGQFQRALHIIGGVAQEDVDESIKKTKENAQDIGLTRYQQPAMVFAHRDEAKISHEVIEFASLPDGIDREKYFKEYLTVVAMAFQTDYQELAPLPGGGLGTSAQSEMLDKKSKAKGPANFRKEFGHMMNHGGILPSSVEFGWEIDDADEDLTRAQTSKARQESINIGVAGGWLDKRSGLQLMLDAGEISQEIYDYNVKRLDKEERDAKKSEEAAAAAPDDTAMDTQQTAGDDNPDAGPDVTDGKIDAGQQRATGSQNTKAKRPYLPKVFARR